jgi:DNA replication protein DnaC
MVQPRARRADRFRRCPLRRPLQPELVKLSRYPLLIVHEVGYMPFEIESANLFFQLVSSRCERVRPMNDEPRMVCFIPVG